MSKSLRRVTRALADAGLDIVPVEMAEGTRTAADAARAIGCDIDQIAKSIVFHGVRSDEVVLFLTAGGHRVDPGRAAALAGEPLERADAGQVRAQTGFAIGGVAPVGLVRPLRTWFDARLLDFGDVWPAAGTPRHVFAIAPQKLVELTGAEVSDFSSKNGLM
ncbi:MAG: YbaK/EbsC family protein [Paracoccaceae bacterium]|nr:YbaK/EbsC family protein [Paracoccaceae bacterium]